MRAQAEAVIAAPIERVWDALVRLDAYAAWNPFVIDVPGAARGASPRAGERILLRVRWADGRELVSPERVLVVEPPRAALDGVAHATFTYRFDHWMHHAHLVRAEHVQTLEQRPGGPTLYRSFEEYRGLLARFTPLPKVQAGFEAQARALQAHAER